MLTHYVGSKPTDEYTKMQDELTARIKTIADASEIVEIGYLLGEKLPDTATSPDIEKAAASLGEPEMVSVSAEELAAIVHGDHSPLDTMSDEEFGSVSGLLLYDDEIVVSIGADSPTSVWWRGTNNAFLDSSYACFAILRQSKAK